MKLYVPQRNNSHKMQNIIHLVDSDCKTHITSYFCNIFKSFCNIHVQVIDLINKKQVVYKVKMNKILLPEFPGNNLLFHAVSHSNTIDTINLLENQEAEPNCRNVNGCTPLHVAVMVQDINLVKVLLKYGADPNIKQYNDIGEKTPLHYSVEKNNYEITNLLLDQGADPTSGDKRGLTVLHYAARLGYVEIVKLLIKYGADINLRDGNGFNAAHWAKMNQFPEIVQMIGPSRCINPNDYREYKLAMIDIHQIKLKKKKKKGKKKK